MRDIAVSRLQVCRLQVVVLARQAYCGIGKTRLQRGLGAARAAHFQRQSCAALARQLAHRPAWDFSFALAGEQPHFLPRAVPVFAQSGGDLGARLAAIFARFFPAPVIVLGSDLPDVRAADIDAARRALRHHDAVIGPAQDGGFWLLGLSALRPPALSSLFASIRWSHAQTYADLRAALAGRRWHELPCRRDIDNSADYRAWARRAASCGVFSGRLSSA